MKNTLMLAMIFLLSGCSYLAPEYISEKGFNIPLDSVEHVEVNKDWAYQIDVYKDIELPANKDTTMIKFLNDLNMKALPEQVSAKGSYYTVFIELNDHPDIRIDFLDLRKGMLNVGEYTFVLLENNLAFLKSLETNGLVFEDENLEVVFDYLEIPETYLYSQITRFEMEDGYNIYRIPNLENKEVCAHQVEFAINDSYYSGVRGCTDDFESFDFYVAKNKAIFNLRTLLEDGSIDQDEFHKRVWIHYRFDDH